jgi:hypothetical protein
VSSPIPTALRKPTRGFLQRCYQIRGPMGRLRPSLFRSTFLFRSLLPRGLVKRRLKQLESCYLIEYHDIFAFSQNVCMYRRTMHANLLFIRAVWKFVPSAGSNVPSQTTELCSLGVKLFESHHSNIRSARRSACPCGEVPIRRRSPSSPQV